MDYKHIFDKNLRDFNDDSDTGSISIDTIYLAISQRMNSDVSILASIRNAKSELAEALKQKCVCTGTAMQYEGRCCCAAGRNKEDAKRRLNEIIEAI